MPGVTPAPSLYPPSADSANYGSNIPTYPGPATQSGSNYSAPTQGTSPYGAPAQGNSTFSAPAQGSSTFGAPNAGTSIYGSGSQGTSNYPSPSTSPSAPASGGNAPPFNPSNPSPPDVKLNPEPEQPRTQAGPASAPRRDTEADARTAARPISTTPAGSVVPAVYAKPVSTDIGTWRPSSR
jgi:hypothetical protein